MRCLTHLEICPYCERKALKVCEYDEPYPRVEAQCLCCGYTSKDIPMEVNERKLLEVLDKLSSKEIGAQCIDDRCGSREVLKLLREGNYREYRCLECGAEWNSLEVSRAIERVKKVFKEGYTSLISQEGECPLCGFDVGHLYKGYGVEIICPVCGYRNRVEEKIPEVDLSELNCPEYEKPESVG